MFEILFHLLKAIKILVKNGKDMRRELLGVNAVQPKSYNQKKIPQRKISVASISMASGNKNYLIEKILAFRSENTFCVTFPS